MYYTPYTFSAKERDLETGYSYFGARYYNATLSVWLSVDPMSDKHPNMSSFMYCAGNPVMLVDPDGRDWVESTDGKIYWDENATSQETTKEGERYFGKAVVVFEGSRNEKLGKGDNILGEGAVTAKVILYGPDGENDITELIGFTMTSDAESFTPIDDGIYTATRREYKGSTRIPKQYQLFEDGKDNIRTLDGVPNANVPEQVRDDGDGFKTEIFIHRTNNNGWAGGRVSVGCLLLCPSSMQTFDNKLKPLGNGTPFSVIVTRD